MRVLTLCALLLLPAALPAQCPLGRTPEDACPEASPACGLYVDANGEGLCDNPGPAGVEEEAAPTGEGEDGPNAEAGADSTDAPVGTPDTSATVGSHGDHPSEPAADDHGPEAEEPGDSEAQQPPEETGPEQADTAEPETTEDDGPQEAAEETDEAPEPAAEPIDCPLGRGPEEACPEDDPGCTLYADYDGDGLCDNAGPQPAAATADTLLETAPDTVTAPTADVAEQGTCPLGRTPETACPEEDPLCALYTDRNADGVCDNPFEDLAPPMEEFFAAGPNTCPLSLKPKTACPDSMALCPHWYGAGPGVRCANPSGGKRRDMIVLIALAVLLPMATMISRHYACRGRNCTRQRNRAHMAMHAVSLMVLGFVVQGCYCPLGAFQYLFLPGGISFLGWMGLAILVLPMVFALFWGRVFCGWVCPMGALQNLLGRIHVPGKPSLPKTLDKVLHYFKYVVLVGLIGYLTAVSHGLFGDAGWPAIFCRIDPFHTIFTAFLVGSLWLAAITILLSIFFGRFFCKYLCFYGAALSLLSRVRLWRLLTGPSRVAADAQEEIEMEEKEVEEDPEEE